MKPSCFFGPELPAASGCSSFGPVLSQQMKTSCWNPPIKSIKPSCWSVAFSSDLSTAAFEVVLSQEMKTSCWNPHTKSMKPSCFSSILSSELPAGSLEVVLSQEMKTSLETHPPSQWSQAAVLPGSAPSAPSGPSAQEALLLDTLHANVDMQKSDAYDFCASRVRTNLWSCRVWKLTACRPGWWSWPQIQKEKKVKVHLQ